MKKSERLDAREVAGLLKIPVVKVQRWVHQGRIPCKFSGSHYFFKRKEIDDWAREHGFCLPEEPGDDARGEVEDSYSLRSGVEKGGVFFGLEGADIVDVLTNAVGCMDLPPAVDKDRVLNELLSREEIASTGIGRGIAIPHPRSPMDLGTAAGMIPVFFLKDPVDFGAVDGKPVSVLFIMFSPSTTVHLKLLSRISFLLRDKDFLAALKTCRTRDQLLALIEKSEKALGARALT